MSTKDERIAELEAERDALAAHVERLTLAPATNEILEEIHRRAGKEWGNDFTVTITRDEYEAFEAEQESLLSATPTTSLARRDARMKAEALESAAKTVFQDKEDFGQPWGGYEKCLLNVAAELRRRAEEADHAGTH